MPDFSLIEPFGGPPRSIDDYLQEADQHRGADMRAVYDDRRMLPQQKRKRLDELTTEANALLKTIVEEVRP